MELYNAIYGKNEGSDESLLYVFYRVVMKELLPPIRVQIVKIIYVKIV